MKKYPSIDARITKDSVYVFDKLDGSNIRAEWSKKKGFWKFGRRKALLDDSNPHLVGAPQLIRDKYEVDLTRILKKLCVQKATCFFELWGPNSFAGNHDSNDDLSVTLFDISIHPKGMLPPKEFLKNFGELDHPVLLHHGKISSGLEEQIRDGSLEGMTFEGVVCKGALVSPGKPLMFKIKNRQWIDKLKQNCDGNQELFQELL